MRKVGTRSFFMPWLERKQEEGWCVGVKLAPQFPGLLKEMNHAELGKL